MRVFMLKPVQVTALWEAALPRAPGHAPAAGARASRRAREPGDRADAGAATAQGSGGGRPSAVAGAVEREALAWPLSSRLGALQFITSQRGGARGGGRGRRSNPGPPHGLGAVGSAAAARLRGRHLLCAHEAAVGKGMEVEPSLPEVVLAIPAASSVCASAAPPRRLVRAGC